MTPADDTDRPTLHIRCGSDIRQGLRQAGLGGAFLEVSDPLCVGPVRPGRDLAERAAFLTRAYGPVLDRDESAVLDDLRAAEAGLGQAGTAYDRVVLWFEHDSYDQLLLAHCLSVLAETALPPRLEMVTTDRYPGIIPFIGLGQLPPEALADLWHRRQPVTAAQIAAGRAVRAALSQADPTALWQAAQGEVAALPYMGAALRRHLQELPWTIDGLSLTQRLVLEIAAETRRPLGQIFGLLMREREPLPWLGDIMFLAIARDMAAGDRPLLAFDRAGDWPHWTATPTEAGTAVLRGALDALSTGRPAHWVGGVLIPSDGDAPWRWDPDRDRPVPA